MGRDLRKPPTHARATMSTVSMKGYPGLQPKPASEPSWQKLFDSKTGQYYWYDEHDHTNTRWDDPYNTKPTVTSAPPDAPPGLVESPEQPKQRVIEEQRLQTSPASDGLCARLQQL